MGNEATGENGNATTRSGAGRSRVRSNVFLSYSHADRETDWFADVREYLAQLSVGDELALWDDTIIQPGADWRASIEEQLRAAKAAVFLVTPTFLTSEFIAGEEVPRLLERQEMEGLVVHALIAKPCDWQEHAIGEFLRSRQLSHSPDRTLEEMEGPERRRGLNELVKQIRADLGIYRQRYRRDRRQEKILELEKLLGVRVDKEVGGGDSSIVYRASRGGQEIAVKAMVSRPITDIGQGELREDFDKCRSLRSTVFVRMFDIEFNNGYCVATTEWVPGHKLSRWLAASRRSEVARRHLQGKTINILSMLASAIAEAHALGLRFLNVHPDKIRLHKDEPRMYPIDFSTYVANSAHSNGVFSFPIDTLEYLAPEYVSKPAEREDALAHGSEADRESCPMSNRADQYALAMVALAMLEGRAPVQMRALADVSRLMRFQGDPRGYAEDGGTPLEHREWRREMPGLARVIFRMLEPDPKDRWNNMTDVHQQLRALQIAEFDAPAHRTDAKASYSRHIMGNDRFYARFYALLCSSSPEIKARFDRVDMAGQRAKLDAAIERVLNFRSNQREPTTLTAVAHSQSHAGLTEAHFEAFGQAFLQALADEDGIDRAALDAWEAVIWPAIQYLKREAAKK